MVYNIGQNRKITLRVNFPDLLSAQINLDSVISSVFFIWYFSFTFKILSRVLRNNALHMGFCLCKHPTMAIKDNPRKTFDFKTNMN